MTRAALLACVCLALPGLAAAQSDESELSRVRRDQGRIAQRLLSLQEKMDRLAERYDAEGRTRNAALLRDALKRLEDEGLLERSRVVEQSLDAGLLATVEQQDELTSGLEAIYALLRDRTDVEQNAERVNLLEQAVSELGFLAEDELGLLQRTRGASDSPAELLDEALGVAGELQEQLEAAGASTAELEDALRGLGESRQAAALAEAQRALMQRAAQPGADAVQRELSAALEGLRESLAEPSSEGGAPGADAELAESLAEARERARELAAQAAAAMERAERRLAEGDVGGARESEAAEGAEGDAAAEGEPTDGGASGEASEGGASEAAGAEGGESGGAQGEGAESSQGGAEGASSSQPGGASEQAGGESQGGESEGGAAQSGGAQSGASQGSEAQSGEAQAGEAQSGGAQGSQGQQGAQAGGTPSEPQDAPEEQNAEEAMQAAAEALEQAAAVLGESERALALQRNRARAEGLAASRQAGGAARELEQLMERLEAAEPDEGPELLDRTRDLLAGVDDAQSSLERGDSGGAAQQQQAAAQDLAALMEQLRARRGGAADTPPEPVDQAGRAQLADEQRDVQRRLRELMDRLSELPDQSFREPAERASQAMEQAEQDLQQGRLDEAGLRQQEAAEEIQKAQEQLEQERDRYDQLRQDEVIFRLSEELTSALEKQRALSTETLDIEELRQSAGRLGRSQRRALARLGGEQRDLAVSTAGVSESLAEDGSVVFVFALERIVDDMHAVADRLEDESTDVLVQSLQSGVERRIEDLLDVLEQELERRREQMEEPQEGEPPGGQPGGSSPMVPPVAELLLVQRMELMALERVERFGELFPEAAEGAELTPIESRELERWALEHARVTDLFESLIPEAPSAGPEADPTQPLPPAPLPPAPPPPSGSDENEEDS